MKYDTLKRKYDPVEETKRDFFAEKVPEKDSLRLVLIDISHQTEQEKSSPSSCFVDEEGRSETLFEENKLYSDSQGRENSSLSIFFKTINRFPLLNEIEERALAQRIKESEQACKNQIIIWNRLFKHTFLKRFSFRQFRDISTKLYQLDESFQVFDKLVMCEKERKKINLTFKRQALQVHAKQVLQGQLYKVESEISKCIAEIHLGKTTVRRTVKHLQEIAKSKKCTRKQQTSERELEETLSKISHCVKELKLLKNQMVQSNLRLVIRIAKNYIHHSLALSDLIQEGNLGLIRAIDTYDYRKGHRFITYATWWIKQAMMRALDCQSRTIRTPVYIKEKLSQIEKASKRLLQESKRDPTLEEIAEEVNISLESVEKVIQSFRDTIPFDISTDVRSENLLNNPSHHGKLSTIDHFTSRDLSHDIDLILSNLTTRERRIVKLRFGIGEKYDHTLEEIAGAFNLSRERIRQILEIALGKLRKPEHMAILKDFMGLN